MAANNDEFGFKQVKNHRDQKYKRNLNDWKEVKIRLEFIKSGAEKMFNLVIGAYILLVICKARF